ncbi:MAG: hypothetical protein IT416_03700 [Candidatus Pacebacteria bacterium]|nr:hypothetical protein [Candidatus Paceibacterota bacterium]
MLIPVFKPLGLSSHQLAKKIGVDLNEKATHTGTLDPMAEGVLIVLTGEDRFKKTEYSSWKKTYQFKILVGIETDTHDLLGLIKNIDHKKINQPIFEKNLKSFIGQQKQLVPKFSAQRINGQSGFELAKKNQPFELQENNIEIFSLEILNRETINSSKLLTYLQKTINLVIGDFRQAEILAKWQPTLTHQQKFELITVEVVTSKRTYIRALVRDLSKKLNIPLTTYSIIRTQNGPFRLKNCKNFS